MHQTSTIAQAALLLYVPIAVLLFQTMDRVRATAIALLGGTLFLPERIEFDLPAIPPLDKHSISCLMVFIMLKVGRKDQVPGRGSWFVPLMIVIAAVGAIGTTMTNRDTLVLSEVVVKQGLTSRDLISMLSRSLLFMVLPFWIGKTVFNTRANVTQLLKITTWFGVVYALLMLVEIRLSPQLNVWVYGFRQHSWSQFLRGDGYRPIVFLEHGLATTLYCVTSIFCAVTLGKAKQFLGSIPPYLVAGFLFIVLALSNSLGALIFGVVVTPILWVGHPRLLSLVASMMAFFVLLVPFLRLFELLPVSDLVHWIARYDADRAQSLGFRFDMEEILIRKAADRLWFGFGGFDRSRIFNDEGEDLVVTDSAWIILLGRQGVLGFLLLFLLLLVPIWAARKHIARVPDPSERALFSGVVIIVAVNTFDLLLNGLFTYLPLLFAGALFGYSETLTKLSRRWQRAH